MRTDPCSCFPLRPQVGKVKTVIQAAQGFDASLQKLIFAGKILSDGQTLEEVKVGEGAFLVCMVSKVRVRGPPPRSLVLRLAARRFAPLTPPCALYCHSPTLA